MWSGLSVELDQKKPKKTGLTKIAVMIYRQSATYLQEEEVQGDWTPSRKKVIQNIIEFMLFYFQPIAKYNW